MQTKADSGTLGQLKSFIWQSLQLKGSKHGEEKSVSAKLSPEGVLRSQNNYVNMPTAASWRIQEWQKSQNFSDKSLAGNSDYVKMESPKKPHTPWTRTSPLGLQMDCDYVNFNPEPSIQKSSDYVNLDKNFSELQTSADYVNLRPDDPHQPRPLTRMNVTLHDQIWSQEDPSNVGAKSGTDNSVLSPPLKHINPNTFWYHADPLDVSDSVSDKSGSSGDTMIMMTSAEARRNEANIEKSRQEYENRKTKVSERNHSELFHSDEELDRNPVINSERVSLEKGIVSAADVDRDSVYDEGYGTDSRASTTNSMSTPLSSSLSSLYSGDADPVSRQPHPKLTSSALKRQIELIPKGRIANLRKVQFTNKRPKKPTETSNNSSISLQEKIMELAIIDEETENESLTASSGSEKNDGSSKRLSEDKLETSPLRNHHRSKSERTVRWLDEENAKKQPNNSDHVKLRVKSSPRTDNLRPKSYSGESPCSQKQPHNDGNSSVHYDHYPPNFSQSSDRTERTSFGGQCSSVTSTSNNGSSVSRPGILRHGASNPKAHLQRHSVAAPLDSLSNSRTLWRSEVDISRPNRNAEFCSTSQIYDRMRAMTRPQEVKDGVINGANSGDRHVRGDSSAELSSQGRPVFATTADIIKLFQSKSKADSFVRAQRHSFNTFHQKKCLEPCEIGRELYDVSDDSEKGQHYRSASDMSRQTCDSSSNRPNFSSRASPSKKLASNTSPKHLNSPSRAQLSPTTAGQPLSLSKLSTLV